MLRRLPISTLFPYTTLFRSVANVAVRQSTGYPELDARAQNWMKRWRFKPNSVTEDRKSTRLNSSHSQISYAVFCLKKKNIQHISVPEHGTMFTLALVRCSAT